MKVKQLLTCLLVLLGSTTVHAYDFDVNGIYYNIIDADASTVEVTYVETGEGNADFYYGNLTIPNRISKDGVTYTVTAIGEEAFHYCNTLTSVTIGKNVTSIGRQAFMKCTTLTTVSLPDGLLHIGYSAFDDCYVLDNVTIPATCTDIEGAAFSDCHSLSSITLPEGLTSIGEWFFDNCTSLTEIVIPNSVTSIGNDAFNGCSGLTSVIVGNGVASIGSAAFSNCTSLAKAEFASIEQLCNISFSNGANPLFCAHHLYINGEEVTEVVIPESITSIGDYTFTGCSYLTSVTIPNSVTSIGYDAFSRCTGLTSIIIPSSVTSIGYGAFHNCSLTSVTIPSSVTSIGSNAFSQCGNLNYVIMENSSALSIDSSVFGNTSCVFYVPNESVDAYKAAEGWSEFADRILAQTGWTFDAPVPNDEGTTNLTFKVTNALPWEVEVSASPEDISGAMTIPATVQNERGIEFAVKSIGEEAFRGRALTSVVLPIGISAIYDNAFRDCASLTSINLPAGIKWIGSWVFHSSGLTSIVIPEGITNFYNANFADCRNLTSVEWPSDLKNITGWTFYQCSSLTSFQIPEGVTEIWDNAFRDSGLESIKFPSTLTEVGNCAFHSCANLKTIDFTGCSAMFDYESFKLCTSLEEIYVPHTVKFKNWNMFAECKSLKKAVFEAFEDGQESWWATGFFGDCSSLEEVVLPSTSVMKTYFFARCTSLKSVTFLNMAADFNKDTDSYYKMFASVPLTQILFTIPDGTANAFLSGGYMNLSDKSALPQIREEFEAEVTHITEMMNATSDGDKTTLTTAINTARTNVNNAEDYLTIYSQITAIKDAAKVFLTTATLTENFDVTGATIVNPDINNYPYMWNMIDGDWSRGLNVDRFENDGVVIDHFIHGWNGDSLPHDGDLISQTITKLPAGVYRLEADVIATNQNDATAEVKGVSLFAGNQKTSVSTEDQKPQHFSVKFENPTTQNVTIGINVEETNANWVAADNFRLYYESKAADIPQSAELKSSETDTLYLYNVETMKYLNVGHSWDTHAILDETGLPIRLTQNEETGLWQIYFFEGSHHDQLLFQNYDVDVDEDSAEEVYVDFNSNREGADEDLTWWSITEAGDGSYLIQNKKRLGTNFWLGNVPTRQDTQYGGYHGVSYTDLIDEASSSDNIHWLLFTKNDCDVIMAKRRLMTAILQMEASGMTDVGTLLGKGKEVYENADATLKEIIDITTLLNSQYGMPRLNEPIDMTSLIINPRFENNTTEGWSGATVVGGRSDATSNQEQEFFEKSFDMYQVITGVPNGRYILKWKGFHRPGKKEDVAVEYASGTDNASAVVYGNEVQKTMKNIASETSETSLNGRDYEYNGRYFSDTMEGARAYFDAGYYADELEVEVKDNMLTIGVKNTQPMSTDHWVIFSDFELYIMENEEQLYHKLSADDVKCVPGCTTSFNVDLQNRDDVTAFQFEMELPEGVSIYEEDGVREVQLTTRGNGHMFQCTKTGDNTYLFSALSLTGKSFKKHEGPIVRMTLTTDATMELGDIPIKVREIELSKPDGMRVLPFDFTSTLTMKAADPGDVNGDGKVTVTDAVCVFKKVNGETPEHFQPKAADVNGDGKITINDAVGIVNMILGNGQQKSARAKRKFVLKK